METKLGLPNRMKMTIAEPSPFRSLLVLFLLFLFGISWICWNILLRLCSSYSNFRHCYNVLLDLSFFGHLGHHHYFLISIGNGQLWSLAHYLGQQSLQTKEKLISIVIMKAYADLHYSEETFPNSSSTDDISTIFLCCMQKMHCPKMSQGVLYQL